MKSRQFAITHSGLLLFSLLIAFPMALAVCLQWIPYDLHSKRMLVIFVCLTILTAVILFILQHQFLHPFYHRRPRIVRLSGVLIALLFGGMIVLNIGISLPERPLFLPDTTLTITNTGEKNERSNGTVVAVKLFETGLTDSFNALKQQGDWGLSNGMLSSNKPSELHWSGKVDKELRLTFKTGPDMGVVRLKIGNSEQQIDLFDPAPNEIYLVTPFSYPRINDWMIFAAYWISLSILCFLLFTVLVWMPTGKWHADGIGKPAQEPWWIYSLPLLVTGVVTLITYWPALMNQDAFSQWTQALTGPISDWHPATYTLLMRLLQQFSASPALVPILQILALSWVMARGIHFLRMRGLSGKIAWLTAIIFALSPVVLLFQISILKDVPYGICFLSANLIFIRIILTDGDWIRKPTAVVALSLSGAGMALFRHNGLPVILAGLVLLILIYRKSFKPLATAAVLLLAITFLIRGPIFSFFDVRRDGEIGINQMYMHTISAHVAEQTVLTADESEWLDNLYPLDQWTYNPWTVGSLLKWPDFDRDKMYANSDKNFQLFLSLTLRRPLITMQHMLRASDMIWHIPCKGCYLYKVILSEQADGSNEWVIQNNIGIKQQSKIPALVKPIYKVYDFSSTNVWLDAITWRPATASYWIFLVAVLLALRNLRWKYLLVGLLPLVQFCLMILITFAQDMRFQYGVILCAIFSLALFFLPQQAPTE